MTKRAIVTPEPSATLVIVRDAAAGIEVFLQQRHPNIPFLGGSYVFPGGKLESTDASPEWRTHSRLSKQEASSELSFTENDLPEKGLAYWIAAIRECYQESGILFAEQLNGTDIDLSSLSTWPPLHSTPEHSDFLRLCQQQSLRLSTDTLTYFSHWITPTHLPKRFDTRFFIARCPTNQTGSHDGNESVASLWISPAAALQRYKQGEMSLIMPTLFTLKFMLDISSVEELIVKAQQNKPIRPNLPIFSNNRLLLPGDTGYDEAIAGL